MDLHPFRSPEAESLDRVSSDANWRYFKKVVLDQRDMMLAAFGEVVMFPLALAVSALDRAGVVASLAAPVFLVLHLTMVIFAFRLAASVYNLAIAVLLVALALLPLFGLFIVRMIDSRATSVLEEHGVKLG